jgi:outer membrane protein assembly factor BamB
MTSLGLVPFMTVEGVSGGHLVHWMRAREVNNTVITFSESLRNLPMNVRTLAFAMVLFISGTAGAADWPQFMGPNRNGVVEGTKLLSRWPANGPQRVWAVKCGKGYAGPALSKGIIVLMERYKEDPNQEVTRGINAATGREIWRTSTPCSWAANRGHTWGPASTPAIGKDMVVCLGIEGKLLCHELSSGKVVWQKDLMKDFQLRDTDNVGWGVVTSPLIVNDLVVVQVCSKLGQAGLVAWNMKDGKEAWRTPYFGNYSGSPGFMRVGDVPVVVSCATGSAARLRNGDLFGFDGRTGENLWSVNTGKSYYNCPTPVFLEGGGGDGPTVAVRLNQNGGAVAWRDQRHLVRFSNYLYYDGLLFGHGYPSHDGPHLLFCDDPKDGSQLWEINYKDEHQWLLGSEGKVIQLRENGELILFDAKARDGCHELAKAKVIDMTWAYPSLADGRLYIRSETELICLDLSAK